MEIHFSFRPRAFGMVGARRQAARHDGGAVSLPGAQAGSRAWPAHPPEPLGTPPLVSPPQAAGAGPRARADQWAVWLNAALLLDVVLEFVRYGAARHLRRSSGRDRRRARVRDQLDRQRRVLQRPLVVRAPHGPGRPGAHPGRPAQDQRAVGHRADPVRRLHAARARPVLGGGGRLRGPGRPVCRATAPGPRGAHGPDRFGRFSGSLRSCPCRRASTRPRGRVRPGRVDGRRHATSCCPAGQRVSS